MRWIACSISRTNSAAAVELRSRYQPVAAVSSASAAGWSSTLAIQASVQIRPDLLPRNGLDFTGIDLTNTTLDLLRPRSLNSRVRLTLQAFEQKPSELRPFTFREF